MDLICPECRAILTVDGRTARCTAHGGEYEVLFDRATESMRRTSGSQVAAPDALCTNHPRTPAAYICPKCSRPVCTMCAYEVGGRQYCPDCATHVASGAGAEPELPIEAPPPPPAPPPYTSEGGLLTLNLTPSPAFARPTVPAGMKCVQHPESDAVTRCRVCSNGVCPVCDFALPNGMHVCPACIENRGTEGVSPQRNYKAWGGIAIALFTTLFFGIAIGGQMLSGENDVAAKVFDIVILVCSVLGVWLSFSAVEPALGNTPLIWTAAIWNTVLLATFVLLSIVGTFMS